MPHILIIISQSPKFNIMKIKNMYSKEIKVMLSSFFFGVAISSIPFFIKLNNLIKENKIKQLVLETQLKEKETACKDANKSSYIKLLDQGFPDSAQKVLKECINRN